MYKSEVDLLGLLKYSVVAQRLRRGGVDEDFFRSMRYMSASDFKTRLLDEKSQLDEKIDKLDSFTKSEQFKTVDKFQADMLEVQLLVMRSYSYILNARIGALN